MGKYITPDIIRVEALDNYLIKILFETKEEKIYDMKPLMEKKFYNKLKRKEYFKKVKPRGETIEWENGEDLIKNNGNNFNLSQEELDLAEKLK